MGVSSKEMMEHDFCDAGFCTLKKIRYKWDKQKLMKSTLPVCRQSEKYQDLLCVGDGGERPMVCNLVTI